MLRIDAGKTGRYCDGMSRRSFVQLGAAGLAAVGLPEILRARELSRQSGGAKRDVATILIWLDGGPSHHDTYDMKPEAAAEIRGLWRPIRTNVPGFEITEMFPRQAKVADKFSLVRSLHHDTGDHFAGGHRMLTAKDMGVSGATREGKFPGLGSIVAQQLGPRRAGMLPYISVPVASSIGLRPGYFGANWLGAQFDPFQTGGDPSRDNFKVNNLAFAPGLTVERLEDRKVLLDELDTISRGVDRSGAFDAMDRFEQNALELVTGERARQAFDIGREDASIRDMYGRHNWGQSTLLARRLVEAGSTFVTVHFGGWDSHWNHEPRMLSYLPRVDSAVAGLLTDLDQRGMLETTLVMLCGEFSRTPRMNDGRGNGTPGRDHWGAAMFCLLAGGGIQGGRIVGSTDDKGYRPQSRPVRPEHIHATVYKAMGIDPKLHLLDLKGRPTPVLDDPSPIDELF